jgi:DNA end-binding protein Ku
MSDPGLSRIWRTIWKRSQRPHGTSGILLLIESMTSEWKPEQYTDLYHEVLEKIVEEKIERGGKGPSVRVKRQTPTNVVDLLSALQQSIQHTQAKPKSEKAATKTRATRRKKAA